MPKEHSSRLSKYHEESRARSSRGRSSSSDSSAAASKERKSGRTRSADKRREKKSSERKKSKKKKSKSKKKSRDSSDSSESDSSSDDSVKLLEKLTKERIRLAEEKKKKKELIKATETPEEKRLRRLMKKQAKERTRKERMGWDNEYLHYTNSDNPFGDGNLLSTFVWNKKMLKEGLTDVSHEEMELRNRFKQEENKRELEKVKKRRQERELERQRREEETQGLQRSKEAAQFEEWERHEDQFHLEQARLRSHIRIQDGRAKPIDLLAKYIGAEEEGVDLVEMHEPYTYLNGLHVKDLEDLVEDIEVYKELERGGNKDYWNDITVIVEDELQKLRKIEKQNEDDLTGLNRRSGIHQAVAQDVTSVFKGKTAVQLAALQTQIEAKMRGKADGIDIGYWESLYSQLKAHMARARLRDRHQENLRRKLQVLKAEQNVSSSAAAAEAAPASPSGGSEGGPSGAAGRAATPEKGEEERRRSGSDDEGSEEEEEEEGEESSAAQDMLKEYFDAYQSGGYSPKFLGGDQLEPGTIVVTEEDDAKRLEFARLQVLGGGKKVEYAITEEERRLQSEARRGMAADEAQFSVEHPLAAAGGGGGERDRLEAALWSDKYRPRKPRYFNRVHTGFEWNKYNQTHYDMDNPPPKIVQGYKFNIFYPDLIDKGATPEYFLTPCPDNREFAVLRFHAGPPYEDIAFKIVNREWEYSYKRGFRCQFHNNIFQLWFHFKRYRYRR